MDGCARKIRIQNTFILESISVGTKWINFKFVTSLTVCMGYFQSCDIQYIQSTEWPIPANVFYVTLLLHV